MHGDSQFMPKGWGTLHILNAGEPKVEESPPNVSWARVEFRSRHGHVGPYEGFLNPTGTH